MKRFLLAGLLAMTMVFGACGDDSEDSTDGGETEVSSAAPEAEQSLDDAVSQLNEAIAAKDCELIMELTFSTLRSNEAGDGPAEPGDPALPEECAKDAPAQLLLADIAGTTFETSEEYGPAAASEGTGGKEIQGYDRWTVLWLVDRDGNWRTTSFYPADPQFEERLPESIDMEPLAEQMVEAIETGDCADAEDFMSDETRFAKGAVESCESLAGGSIFAPAVKSADEVTVEELGRTRDYGMVGIDTGDTYFVAQFATPPIKAGEPVQDEAEVVDVLPVTDFDYVEPPKEKKQ